VAEPAFLLDSNILIYLIGGLSEALRRRVEEQPPGTILTSALCVAEAEVGLKGNAQARRSLSKLLAIVEPLSFDLSAARRFADVPFRRAGIDRFIAAHALSAGLILVTNNEADFADVPGLRIENWTIE
jgi:tRNA(fMet)-specific endonuclease VapC